MSNVARTHLAPRVLVDLTFSPCWKKPRGPCVVRSGSCCCLRLLHSPGRRRCIQSTSCLSICNPPSHHPLTPPSQHQAAMVASMLGSNAPSSSQSQSTLAPLFDMQTLLALAYVASMVATALGLAAIALPKKGAVAQETSSTTTVKTRSKKSASTAVSEQDEVTRVLAGSKVKYIFTWLVFDAICHLTRACAPSHLLFRHHS